MSFCWERRESSGLLWVEVLLVFRFLGIVGCCLSFREYRVVLGLRMKIGVILSFFCRFVFYLCRWRRVYGISS